MISRDMTNTQYVQPWLDARFPNYGLLICSVCKTQTLVVRTGCLSCPEISWPKNLSTVGHTPWILGAFDSKVIRVSSSAETTLLPRKMRDISECGSTYDTV